MAAIEIDLNELQTEIKECESRLSELRATERYVLGKQKQVKETAGSTASITSSATGDVSGELSQADAAEHALRLIGREAKVKEIVQVAAEKGWIKTPDTADDLRNRNNSMYGAMKRFPDRFKLAKPGTWDLVIRGK